MKYRRFYLLLSMALLFSSCGGFKSSRVDADASDDKLSEVSDEWGARDTDLVIEEILKKMKEHKGFARYLRRSGNRTPKVFIGEIQNLTSEAYFPINDLNDAFLNEISASGDFVLVDAGARDAILKEITYQNDGMVDPSTAKTVGKQIGADLMVFGNVYMRPKKRDGKTVKEYAINLRMTDVERAVEVLRTRARIYKYSKKSKFGW